MNTLSINLNLLLLKHKLSASALARATGISQPTIHRILTGESKDPKSSNLYLIAKFFGVTMNTLLEEDSSFEIGAIRTGVKAEKYLSVNAQSVPIITATEAIKMEKEKSLISHESAVAGIYTDSNLSEGAYAILIEDHSMHSEFCLGDCVIIDPKVPPLPGDFVLASIKNREATFRRYREHSVNAQGKLIFELTPLNPDYPTLRSDHSRLRILGVMLEHRKYRRK